MKETIFFNSPIACSDCRLAFLAAKNKKQVKLLIADRLNRSVCMGCPSLAEYQNGHML